MSFEEFIYDQFINQKKSPYEISEHLKKNAVSCYPNKIRRILINMGVKLRSKSEAQKVALETGRTKHPTLGTHRSETTKEIISRKAEDKWANMPIEERQRRSNLAKEQWRNMTDEERLNLSQKSAKAIRNAADYGSKMERFLLYNLRKLGYKVDFHFRNLISSEKFQVDLYLPDLKTAIEVDGTSHFEPIWGNEAFDRVVSADQEKNGALLGQGYNVIRMQVEIDTVSIAYKRRMFNLLLPILQRIEQVGTLPIEERLIFIKDKQWEDRKKNSQCLKK